MPFISVFYQAPSLAPQSASEPEKEARIESLLEQARGILATSNPTESGMDNAAEYVAKVLKISPRHSGAIQLSTQVLDRMLVLGALSLKQGDLARARAYHGQAKRWAEAYGISQARVNVLAKVITAKEQRLAEIKRGEQKTEEEARLAEQRRIEQAFVGSRLQELLEKGRKAFDENRLTAPAGDNAMKYVRRMLALAPRHEAALELVRGVVGKLIQQAEMGLEAGNLDGAKILLEQTQSIARQYPIENRKLAKLADQIATEERRLAEAEREKQRRIQQAKREEQRLAQINDLVQKAQQALADNRLSVPAGHNATVYAEQVLKLQPNHREGQRVLEGVAGRYIALGEVALSKGQLEARKREELAERLVQRYGLPGTELRRLTLRIDAQEKRLAESPRKLPETDIPKAAKALDRQKEERQEQTAPSFLPPPKEKREVFIPPSF